jgi:hypothetical protein
MKSNGPRFDPHFYQTRDSVLETAPRSTSKREFTLNPALDSPQFDTQFAPRDEMWGKTSARSVRLRRDFGLAFSPRMRYTFGCVSLRMSATNTPAAFLPPETARTRLQRSIGYGVPSVLALLCGFFTYSSKVFLLDPNLLLLVLPIGISIPFFAAYSFIFTPRPRTTPIDPDELRQEQDLFFVLLIIGPGLIGVLGGALPFWLVTRSMPPWSLLAPVIMFPSMLLGYGAFLLWRYSPEKHFALRYQLIWPITTVRL